MNKLGGRKVPKVITQNIIDQTNVFRRDLLEYMRKHMTTRRSGRKKGGMLRLGGMIYLLMNYLPGLGETASKQSDDPPSNVLAKAAFS